MLIFKVEIYREGIPQPLIATVIREGSNWQWDAADMPIVDAGDFVTSITLEPRTSRTKIEKGETGK
jgi:hypothetical protein